MTYEELCSKDVVSACDCRKIGKVVDLELDGNTGCILKIHVAEKCGICGFFCPGEEYEIKFCNIKQIGPDVILVNLCK